MKYLFILLVIAAALGGAVRSLGEPLGTAFTYQGHLSESGHLANELYDFRFSLHNDPVANSPLPIGSPITVTQDDLRVTNGLFTVELDFGSSFNGEARWLEIEVRSGDSNSSPYTVLSPRQLLTATPQALWAAHASYANAAASVLWTNIGGVPFYGSGTSNTLARSDHNHFGDLWSGDLPGDAGLNVINTASGGAGLHGQANSVSGSAFGVTGSSFSEFGGGIAGYGYSADGRGVLGVHTASTGPGAGVEGWSSSSDLNAAGVFGGVSSVGGFYSAGVRGENYATTFGYGVYGYHAGNGSGVFGRTSGDGWGVAGEATSGVAVGGTASARFGYGVYGAAGGADGFGVYGYASDPTGVGVYASGSGTSGTALAINNGAIRVVGAGPGTSTAVFVHNSAVASHGTYGTQINNPYCNGRADAILIVTQRTAAGDPIAPYNKSVGTYYNDNGGFQKWEIINQDGTSFDYTRSHQFAVLVILP